MFIAMNRFKIDLSREQDFIDIWKKCEAYLDGVKLKRSEPNGTT